MLNQFSRSELVFGKDAMERLKNAGYNLESFTWPKLYMYEKLDDEAWNKWVEQREDKLPHGDTVRPAPPEYAK